MHFHSMRDTGLEIVGVYQKGARESFAVCGHLCVCEKCAAPFIEPNLSPGTFVELELSPLKPNFRESPAGLKRKENRE